MVKDVIRTKEGRMLANIHGSFAAALRTLIPDWDSSRPPSLDIQRRLLENIGRSLGVTQVPTDFFLLFFLFFSFLPKKTNLTIMMLKHSDWYAISQQEFTKTGGQALLKYHGSLASTLKALHPDIVWAESQFHSKADEKFWNSRVNRRALLDTIGKELGIRQVRLKYRYLNRYLLYFLFCYFVKSHRIGIQLRRTQSLQKTRGGCGTITPVWRGRCETSTLNTLGTHPSF